MRGVSRSGGGGRRGGGDVVLKQLHQAEARVDGMRLPRRTETDAKRVREPQRHWGARRLYPVWCVGARRMMVTIIIMVVVMNGNDDDDFPVNREATANYTVGSVKQCRAR